MAVMVSEQDIRYVAKVVRRKVLTTYSPDSCVATASAITDALRQFGADTYELSVSAMVCNEEFAKAAGLLGRLPSVAEYHGTGAYALGLGMDIDKGPVWAGHVVAIVDRRWMVDASIDQASRPEQGIVLRPDDPIVMPVAEAFLRGREPLLAVNPLGVAVRYDAKPGDRGFRVSPNYRQIEVVVG